MKHFINKILIFSLPGILLLIPPLLILKITGENYTDIDNLIESQKKYFIGYAYNENNYKYLKWKELTSRKPQQVVALGSSRVLQFREEMFESSFYNAGFTISRITDFVPFLKSLPSIKYPEVLIIGLDQWMFNENWDTISNIQTNESKWRDSFTKYPRISTFRNVWKDLFSGKYGFDILRKDSQNTIQKIGLNTFVNDKGFRKDGSNSNGAQIIKLQNGDPTANDFNFANTYLEIKKSIGVFHYGNQINPKALLELDNLLDFCKHHKIYLIGFLPPFADAVNERLEKSGKYVYMDSLYSKSKVIFEKHNFELWDMTHLSKYQSNDKETIDGFHGSEVSYIKMLIYMTENHSRLEAYTNLQMLKNDLSNKRNNYIVYEYY